MIDQTFSKKNLDYSFIKSDFEIGKKADEIIAFKENNLNRSQEIIKNKEIPIYIRGHSNKRVVFKLEELPHLLIVRNIISILKKIYKINYSSRDTIIRELLPLLGNSSPYQVVRLDISSFYDSIPLNDLMSLINKNEKILEKTKWLIRLYLSSMEKERKEDGLMAGHPLSSILSEVYMADFDKVIKSLDDVVLYHRFVDDIIIVTCKRNLEKNDFIQKIQNSLPFSTLRLNKNKQEVVEFNRPQQNGHFNFLGYKILVNGRAVKLQVEEKKIKKMKKKIYFSIKKFNAGYRKYSSKANAERELSFFLDSMKCLASASIMKKKKLSLPVGNKLNYKFLTCEGESFKPLDIYLHSIPYVKSNLEIQKFNSTLIKYGLHQKMIGEINKISFIHFYKKSIFIQFPRERAKEIWGVWKYV